MMSPRRWLLAPMLCLALSMLCAQAADLPRVGLIMKSLANPFFVAMAEGAKAHAQSHAGKYTLVLTGIENETDKAGQIRLVEKMISDKVSAIVIAPADSRDLVPVVRKALAAGILVVNIDNKFDDRVLAEQGINIPFVGPSNRQGAREVGAFLARQLKPGDKVAIIEGISSTTNAQARTAGFREAMASVGADVVAVRSGLWETAPAQKLAADLLKAHPDLKALLCGNDSMALGAVAAVRASQRPVAVVGYDNIPAAAPLLASGQLLATADQYAAQQAAFGIDLVLKAIQEKTEQALLPAMVQTPVKLVVK